MPMPMRRSTMRRQCNCRRACRRRRCRRRSRPSRCNFRLQCKGHHQDRPREPACRWRTNSVKRAAHELGIRMWAGGIAGDKDKRCTIQLFRRVDTPCHTHMFVNEVEARERAAEREAQERAAAELK
eukprot:TRINITY_DN5576_c0_g1_i4.p2 TRINITY_DN5576_c0_g1~~TRINITY_DN5576_c0_g1_i4.p2  ORF type:complete len:126 (+),score=5.56 TRINITY_DN5576_c0_g1_i4:546-923(+)